MITINTSDIINIILCVLSFVLATISVITVIITLKQNHKMIKNSTRPYVAVTVQATNFQNPQMYLVLKNYGNSGARILDFVPSIKLDKYSMVPDHPPFGSIENTFLAPSQKIIVPINAKGLNDDNHDVFTIKITYTDDINTYTEEYPINYIGLRKNVQIRAATKDKELRTISYTLQDIAEKQL